MLSLNKEEGKDLESIQLNATSDLGHNMGKWQKKKKVTKHKKKSHISE